MSVRHNHAADIRGWGVRSEDPRQAVSMARARPSPKPRPPAKRAMHHRSAGGVAVDFVNTVACRACRTSDGLASPAEFARWNRAHPDLPRFLAVGSSLGELRLLREELRASFQAETEHRPPNPRSLARLNRTLHGFRTHLHARYDEGHWRFDEVPEVATPGQRWMSAMVRAATELLGGSQAEKLRKCQAPECDHFLVSRMRAQLWCSPTGCGNRVRVARHYRKVKRKRGGRRSGDRAGPSSRGRAPRPGGS